MPIHLKRPLLSLPESVFSDVAYGVMEHAFAIHNKLGRFCSEGIYQCELQRRIKEAEREFPITVTFGDFSKTYYIDLLVADGAVFELKTVKRLTDRHRAQLLTYMLLTELSHGKMVNFRPESVEHEFVNTTLTHRDRTCFAVEDGEWREASGCSIPLKDRFVEILRDWGTSLDLALYTEALTHFLGGRDRVVRDTVVQLDGHSIGKQKVRYSAAATAFKVTTVTKNLDGFENHMRRFLGATTLQAIQWINVHRDVVQFKTIR